MNQAVVEDIVRVLTRIPVPRGQIALFKALVEVEGAWVAPDAVGRHLHDGNKRRFASLLAALSKRVNGTALETTDAKPGIGLLADSRVHDGVNEYRAKSELIAAIRMIPALQRWLGKPWPEIVEMASRPQFSVPGISARSRRNLVAKRSSADALWVYLDGVAEERGEPWSLRVRWSADADATALAVLTAGDGDPEATLLADTVRALESIDVEAIAAHMIDPAEADRWREGHDAVLADPTAPMSLNAASRFVFGPYFNPDRGSHNYNAWVHFDVHPDDVEHWLGDVTEERGWTRLVVLRGAFDEAEGAPVYADDDEPTVVQAPLDMAELVTAFDDSERVRHYVLHNVGLARLAWGCRALLRVDSRDFDFIGEYWHRPERRVLVAYLARKWDRAFAPAAALRALAHHLVVHFDRGRADGVFAGLLGMDYGAMGGWSVVCGRLIAHAERLPPLAEFAALRAAWGVSEASAGEHLVAFLDDIKDDPGWSGANEPAFSRRVPWFPFLRGERMGDLRGWQDFFFHYVGLLTATNAYRMAGAQAFAGIIQNTRTGMALAQVGAWRADAEPVFRAYGAHDDVEIEPADRAHYATVIELYGFLHLDRVPFYNNATDAKLRAWFGAEHVTSKWGLTQHVGERTRAFLDEHPAVRDELARRATEWFNQAPPSSMLQMEAVRAQRAQRRAGESDLDLIHEDQMAALANASSAWLEGLDDTSRAAVALHLLVDSVAFTDWTPATRPVATATGVVAVAVTAPIGDIVTLPGPLRAPGERALAYLKAGLHVLFAGAPGTGKTTLAQFVAHAWNARLPALASEFPLADAPTTTVANSAWSPFHTVGGLRPAADGGFESVPGIFVDRARTKTGNWFLRPECIVLDEMNRADLDRCVGDLYPLLSHSVRWVTPAGLPRVQTLSDDPRFRVVATVNDASLDDIVFPISEGLARRFQRIDLLGASEDDLRVFLDLEISEAPTAHVLAVQEAVSELFVLATKAKLIFTQGGVDRLPFGAGYFKLVKVWLAGTLHMPDAFQELDAGTQARQLMYDALSTAVRVPRFERLMRALRDE